MGVLVIDCLGVRKIHVPQRLQGPLPPLLRRELGMNAKGFLHLRADAHDGVHGAHRLLKYHRNGAALPPAHLGRVQRQQILAVQQHLSRYVRLPAGHQAGYHHGGNGLAAAALAYQTHDLAVGHRQVDTPDGLMVGVVKADVEVLDLQHGHAPPFRRPSPIMLTPRISSTITRPVHSTYHGAFII